MVARGLTGDVADVAKIFSVKTSIFSELFQTNILCVDLQKDNNKRVGMSSHNVETQMRQKEK